jgi:hypothetical protein
MVWALVGGSAWWLRCGSWGVDELLDMCWWSGGLPAQEMQRVVCGILGAAVWQLGHIGCPPPRARNWMATPALGKFHTRPSFGG